MISSLKFSAIARVVPIPEQPGGFRPASPADARILQDAHPEILAAANGKNVLPFPDPRQIIIQMPSYYFSASKWPDKFTHSLCHVSTSGGTEKISGRITDGWLSHVQEADGYWRVATGTDINQAMTKERVRDTFVMRAEKAEREKAECNKIPVPQAANDNEVGDPQASRTSGFRELWRHVIKRLTPAAAG